MLTLTQNEVFAGRYRVLRSVASGGMGAVYEVEHVETARHHALKVLLPSLVDRNEIRDRFKQEARITATIDSDAIVQVFDAGVDADTGMPFLVMELLKGEDLSRVLTREGPLPPSIVISYLAQVASALDKTHEAKVVHRDLKPENLFVSRKDDGAKQIKILDFGVAKLLVEGVAGASSTTGFGTPLYMAPEQFKCSGVTSATDIYSLGMIAFTLLVGTPYWEPEVAMRGTVFAFATLAVNGTREPASQRASKLGKELPPEFDKWFARMTAVDPTERYQKASLAIDELAGIFSVLLPARPISMKMDEPVSAAAPRSHLSVVTPSEFAATQANAPSRPRPAKSRSGLIAGGVALAIAAAVMIAFLARREPAASPVPSEASSTPASLASASASEVSSSAPPSSSPEPIASAAPSAAPALSLGLSGTLPGGGGLGKSPKARPTATVASTASAPIPPPTQTAKSRYTRE